MDPLEALREALWPVLPVPETVRVLRNQPYGDGMTDDDSLLWRCDGSRETGWVGIEVVRVMDVDHDLTFYLNDDVAVLPEMDGPGVILVVLELEVEDAPHVGQLLAGGLDDLVDRFTVKGCAWPSEGKGLLLRREQVRMGRAVDNSDRVAVNLSPGLDDQLLSYTKRYDTHIGSGHLLHDTHMHCMKQHRRHALRNRPF